MALGRSEAAPTGEVNVVSFTTLTIADEEEPLPTACYKCAIPSLAGQQFCASCGARLDLDLYIADRVAQVLSSALKDREVLETESAIKVFEKAYGWIEKIAKVSAIVAAIVIAVVFWQYGSWKDALNAARQSFSADVTLAKTQMGTDLTAFQKAVGDSRVALQGASELQPQMTAMQGQLERANRQLQAQQKVLSSTDTLAKMIFSSHVTKSFARDVTDHSRFAIIADPAKHSSLIFLLLDSPAIPQTVQLQWGALVQPLAQMSTQHNLLIIQWGEALSDLTEDPLTVLYFPDTSDKVRYQSVSVKQGKLYLDGREEDPSKAMKLDQLSGK